MESTGFKGEIKINSTRLGNVILRTTAPHEYKAEIDKLSDTGQG